MKKHVLLIIYTLLGILFFARESRAQFPPKILCPAVPAYEFFDTLCFIPSGTLVLHQGKAANVFSGQPILNLYVPSNRWGWALGIAHSWNYTRNTLRMPTGLTMDLWMAIAGGESQLACIPGTAWTPTTNESFKMSETNTNYNADGCFHFENTGAWISGAGEMRQVFPTRFVYTNASEYFNYTFERGSLCLAYEFVMKTVRARYKYGVDPYPLTVGACDPYAINKIFASFHNMQTWSFVSSHMTAVYNNRAVLPTTCNWTNTLISPGSGLGNADYIRRVGTMFSAVNNNTGYGDYRAGSSASPVFNPNIPWDTVQAYLTRIRPFYNEYTNAMWTDLTNKVRAKFINVSGSIATPIPFQNLGPVIDVIILGLPKEDPTIFQLPNQSMVGNWEGKHGCWGDIVPIGHIGVPGHKTTICLGNSITLNGIVDGGESSDISFKWFVNGSSTPFATTRDITFAPTAVGTYTYTFATCNSKGCMPANCGVTITVNNCGGCGMTVNATSINTPCQNMKAGTINLTVGGSTDYTVNYTGPVSGSITSASANATIPNLPDGTYNIEVISNTNPSCKAYTTRSVLFTTAQNAQLSAAVTSYPTTCSANVKATIVENDVPCLWKIKFFTPVNDWSPAVYAVITPGNGRPGMYQANIQNPAHTWEDVTGEMQFYASTGDPIIIDLTVSPTPGASNLRPITFQIINSAGAIVWTGTVPANAVSEVTGVINYHVTTYTPTCPFNPNSYTFAWSPTLSTVANTATQSTGTVNIDFTVPTMYTVTATNSTNTQCTLTDTVWIQPTCPVALGVDFAWFEAELVNNNYVYLHWATLKEENASHFEIERSSDGINFTTIGRINANGNSSTLLDYQFNDMEVLHGTIYYRIAEVDHDGTVQYSSMQIIQGLRILATSVYPNPSTNNFTVQIEGEGRANVSIIVYDILGNKLEENTANLNDTLTIGDNLAAGTYLLHIIKPDETTTVYKLIKQ